MKAIFAFVTIWSIHSCLANQCSQVEVCNNAEGYGCFTLHDVCDGTCTGCDIGNTCRHYVNGECDGACIVQSPTQVNVVCCACYENEPIIGGWVLIFLCTLAILLFFFASRHFATSFLGSPAVIGFVIALSIFLSTYAFAMSYIGYIGRSFHAWFNHIGHFYGMPLIAMVVNPALGIAVVLSPWIKSKFINAVTAKDINTCLVAVMGAAAALVYACELGTTITLIVFIHDMYTEDLMHAFRYLSWLGLIIMFETLALTAWFSFVSYKHIKEMLAHGNQRLIQSITDEKIEEQLTINAMSTGHD